MKRFTVFIMTICVLIIGVAKFSYAIEEITRFNLTGVREFKPAEMPVKPGPATLKLSLFYQKSMEDIEYSVVVENHKNLSYSGKMEYIFYPQKGQTTVLEFPVIIPQSDTSYMKIHIDKNGAYRDFMGLYFVSTQDSVEVWCGYPRKRVKIDYTPEYTEEELNEVKFVRLLLDTEDKLDFVKELLGEITPQFKNSDYYDVKIRVRDLQKISEYGIWAMFIDENHNIIRDDLKKKNETER